MQPAQGYQQNYCNELSWAPIAQYSVSEDTLDENIETVILASMSQPMQQLKLPDDRFRKITQSITQTVRKARRQCSQDTSNSVVKVHLFCQRESLQDFPNGAENPLSRGWGYYVIDKCDSLAIASCERQDRLIEIYLYKEGE